MADKEGKKRRRGSSYIWEAPKVVEDDETEGDEGEWDEPWDEEDDDADPYEDEADEEDDDDDDGSDDDDEFKNERWR